MFKITLSIAVFCLRLFYTILSEKFTPVTQWTHLNYSWRSRHEYQLALESGTYIPENNAPTGVKIFRNTLFLSIPRFRDGIPATLTTVQDKFYNPLLEPFPSWEANDPSNCLNLQSVQSMEIDTSGVMWVLDGVRINGFTACPTKIVLLDLEQHGRRIDQFVFPNDISAQEGGFLNDIVIDEADNGDFAYITDNSPVDPGIIVFSRLDRRAWKIRDKTMFPDENALPIVVNNNELNAFFPLDGIALSTKPRSNDNKERSLFYCAMASFNLYSVAAPVLKNETLCKNGEWRNSISLHGTKLAQSDGIMIDSKDTMFYTLLPLDGVARWNVNWPLKTSVIIDSNRETMVWPDGFAFDQLGYIYLISNQIYKFINPNFVLDLDGSIQFRIHRLYVGSRSYLYNDVDVIDNIFLKK